MRKILIAVTLFTSFSILLNGCSTIGQVLGSKTSKPIPLKPLKPVTASVSTHKSWEVKTTSVMGEYTIHPYIDGEAVYIAGSNTASAWHKKTGKLLWKADIGEAISAGVNGSFSHTGKTQQIFIGTSNGNAISLDAKTGKIQWIERLSSEIQSISPSKDGRVAFRTIDGKLHGLTSTTGELVWQNSQPSPTLTLQGASVPILVGPLIIAGFDNGKMAAYHFLSGQKAWEVTLTSPRGQTELDRIIDIDGKIKSLGNALFSTSLHGNMSAINVENGSTAWTKRFSSSTGIDANEQALYSSDNSGNIWKLIPQTGDPVWKMDDLQRYEPTLPVLVSSSLLAVGDKKGNIHWINTKTGLFVSRNKGDPAGYSVEPEVSGNSIYALGKAGILSKITIK